jgi:hypothetical protein
MLSYGDHLPLHWRPLAETADARELDRYDADNLGVLHAVAALEEHRELPNEANPLESEINRLHQKVDLLLHLVGNLARGHQQLPAPVTLSLSARGVHWTPLDAGPAAGARILVEIHLHRGIAQPLCLPARVKAASAAEIDAEFELPGEACLAALERHVFLHHRRSIADARSAAQR